jgi:YVTN family beta-propeller protein
MLKNQKNFRILLLTSCFLLLTFFLGCTTIKEQVEPSAPSYGQITLFLNGPVKASLDITFKLLAVNIVAEDGTPREVMNTPLSINSIDVAGRQILLGEKTLPEGKYKKLQFVVKEASIKRKGKIASLALPPEGIEIVIDIKLKRMQNTSLFLIWNVDASIVDGYQFNPIFTVKGEVPELSSLLIYVTNEDSNNVSVINRQSGKVVATIMVGERPRGIATGLGGGRLRVYVANSGSNNISVIDPTTNKIEYEIPIRFGREPEDIVVAKVSSEKELIFITNYRSNTVSVVDSTTYQEIEKIDVGDGPVAVAVDPPIEALVGTRFLTTEEINILRDYREKFLNVYVVNRNSNDISVLRMDILRDRCDEVINIDVEWSPVAVEIDYKRGKVYVANYDSDKLSVIDILQIVKGNKSGAVSTISDVGTSIIGVVADPVFDRIYLLKEVTGEIMIIKPVVEDFETLKRIMTPIMGTIAVGDYPRSLILDLETRRLYVVNRGSNNISVIDRITKKEEQVIPVGRKPYGIAMFPY